MKNKHIFIPLFVFVGAIALSAISSIIDFKATNRQLSYYSQTIQFDYDGASDGKDPNGNPFNAVDFLSDEILADAITRTGLSYDVKDVKKYVLIENVVPKDVVEEIVTYDSLFDTDKKEEGQNRIGSKDYHPVRYRFALYKDLDQKLSNDKYESFIANIVDSYCDAFYSAYNKVYDKTVYDSVYAIDEYDYVYQAEIYTSKLQSMVDYARSVYSRHEDFLSSEGKTFNDIALRAEQLISTDVTRINNIITLNALSKDLPQLKDYYTYKITDLNFDKAKYTSDLAAVNAQIAAYTKDPTIYVTNGETVITIDSNGSVTYDSLNARQIELSNKIAAINAQIAEYNAILTDINSATGTEEDYALVKSYIQKLGNDYAALEEQFNKLLVEYNDKYVADGIVSKSKIKYTSDSVFSTAFVSRCIKIGAPIMLVVMLGIGVFYFIRTIQKTKRKAL